MIETLAVVGATGAVGRIILQLLAERQFPAKKIRLLASARSAGRTIDFGGTPLAVEEMTPEAFAGVTVAIGSTPDEVAREFVPWAVEKGAIVVDESASYRMDPNVPLVIPEVNPQAIRDHKGIIASPNCSTTQMVMALKPLHDAARVKRVVVSTYQAVSGAGLSASEELRGGMRGLLADEPEPREIFPHPIAGNLIPQIGSPRDAGYTSEEMKMVLETRKILGDDSIGLCVTCVRVPVFNGHSESLLVETEKKLSAAEARELLAAAPGVIVQDDLGSGVYPTPRQATGSDAVFVGRIREDLSSPNGLTMWCVSDNLRKGAATNAVQIAEVLAQ